MRPHNTAASRRRDSAGQAAVVLVIAVVLLTAVGVVTLSVVGADVDEGTGDEELVGGQDVRDPFEVTSDPTTYEAFTYSPLVRRPTASGAQSKLWFADDTWWGLLVNPGDDLVHIYELTETHLWRDTGTVVDDRVASRGDALWDEAARQLVVATAAQQSPVLVTRFGYDPDDRSWTLADGFPQTVPTGGSGPESVTVAQDSTGRLWLTYTQPPGQVMVAHSDPGGTSWTAGFSTTGADTDVGPTDISAVVAFDSDGSGTGTDSIGVFWSDQESDAFRFAIHRDGSADTAWRVETALAGPGIADGHVNVKTVPGGDGDVVLAAVKTSKNEAEGPDATLVAVLVRRPPEAADQAGQWSMVPAGTVEENQSRPIVLVDAENQELLLFTTPRPAGGSVYVKRTSLSDMRFPEGRGEPFIGNNIRLQSVTGTKQPLDARTGLLVLAHAPGERRFIHAEASLAPAGADR